MGYRFKKFHHIIFIIQRKRKKKKSSLTIETSKSYLISVILENNLYFFIFDLFNSIHANRFYRIIFVNEYQRYASLISAILFYNFQWKTKNPVTNIR